MIALNLNGTRHTGRTVESIVRREVSKTATVKIGNAVGAGRSVTVTQRGKVVARGIAYGV